MAIIDLSVVLNEKTPFYPGDPATTIKPAAMLNHDGYTDHYISVGTHVGTHVDAPIHMLEDGKSLDQMPIDQFVGHGRYIKVQDKKFSLADVESADIKAGDIVLFHTGMSDVYFGPAYYDAYPAIPEDVANYLVKKKVKMVGVDMCSVDHEPFSVHKILLSAEVLIIENLTNLGALAGKDFTVYALPLKLQVDGAPARVIAEVN